MGADTSKPVTVLGAGEMGSALVRALIADGRQVCVWNRTRQKCEPLRQAGAFVAASVKEAATFAGCVVVCVRDYRATKALLKREGVSTALRGKILVQLTTGTPDEARAFAAWCNSCDVRYLDGAIMSYPRAIGGETCLILYSGAAAVFTEIRPLLLALGGNPMHLGEEAGLASMLDMAALSLQSATLLGFLHGAAICKSQGWPLEAYVSLMPLALSALGEEMKTCGEMFQSGDYRSKGLASLRTDAAVLDHVVHASRESGVDPGLPAHLRKYLRKGIVAGHGDDYVARLLEILGTRGE